jgi:uncharacterized protein YjdB
MKKTNKLLALALLVVMLFSLVFTTTAFAAYDNGDNVWNSGVKVNFVPYNGQKEFRGSDWSSNTYQNLGVRWFQNPLAYANRWQGTVFFLRIIQAANDRQNYARLQNNGYVLNFEDKGMLYPDAQNEAQIMVSLGVLKGYPDGYMKPDLLLTRAEMAKIDTMYNDTILRIPATRGTPNFTDTQYHWAKEFISYAYQCGFVNGDNQYNFGPDRNVTIEELVQTGINIIGSYGITVQDVGKAINETFKATVDSNSGLTSGNALYSRNGYLSCNFSNVKVSVDDTVNVRVSVDSRYTNNLSADINNTSIAIANVSKSTSTITLRGRRVGNTTARIYVSSSDYIDLNVEVTDNYFNGSNNNNNNYNNNQSPTSISLTNVPSNMNVGDTLYVSYQLYPYNSYDNGVTYSSSNTSVLYVSSSGRIEAKRSGTATLRVTTSNNKSDSITIRVSDNNNWNNNQPTSISLTNVSSNMNVGDTLYVSYQLYPYNSYDNGVTYSSSNTSVLYVSNSGRIEAKRSGTATLRVTTSNNRSDSITIRVNDNNNWNDDSNNGNPIIYVEGYEPQEYYNAFVNETFSIVVENVSSFSTNNIHISNSNIAIVDSVQNLGGNKYRFRVKCSSNANTSSTITINNLSLQVRIYQ